MSQMGLHAVYPRLRTSLPGKRHRIYPNRLRGLTIDRPNQVWANDISYIPLAQGFIRNGLAQPPCAALAGLQYLETDFYVDALEEVRRAMDHTRYSTQTKAASSPARPSSVKWKPIP